MSLGKSIFGVPIGRPTFESITAPIAAKAQELRIHATHCASRVDELIQQIDTLYAQRKALEAECLKSQALAAKLEGVL